MRKEQKIKKDRHDLVKYMKRMENQRQEIKRMGDAYCLTGHKNRVNTIGEIVLKLLEDFYKKQGELKLRGHKMLDGTLFWIIEETRVKDPDGKKGFHYSVGYMVKTSEPMYTKEEIQKEMEETYQKMKQETEEMYGEPVTDDDYGVIHKSAEKPEDTEGENR